ncbi:prophage tail fiber N-terminal domain-containing protein [Escherichia coli]
MVAGKPIQNCTIQLKARRTSSTVGGEHGGL